MRIDQAHTIPIAAFLEKQGVLPAHSRLSGQELWYSSPLREGDSDPSFKINTQKNVWYDHGLSRGGDIIDLVKELCSCDVRDALRTLERSGLQFSAAGSNYLPKFADRASRGISAGEKKKNGALELVETRPLQHPALLGYLQSRKINPEIAREYLSEIDFKRPGAPSKYFGLAYPSGKGFEVRNALFKGFVGTGKDVTFHAGKNHAQLFVFEGFMDFLSYLTQKNSNSVEADVLVLNSTAMKARALPYIQKDCVKEVRLYLDNDESGSLCTEFFTENAGLKKIADMREYYANYEDLNEWLVQESA